MTDFSRRHFVGSSAAMVAALGAGRAFAQNGAVASFYRGRTIQLIIGGSPGVSYDIAGRAVAAHITKHIPGNPRILVQNMPGASSLIMTNHLYNAVDRDGSVFGAPLNNVILESKLKLLSASGGNVQFDVDRMNWIGSPVKEPQILCVWHTAPAQTLEQLRTTPLVMGGTSVGADNHTLPTVVNRLIGGQMKVVLGYKGPNDVLLAAERGEVHGLSVAYSTLMTNQSAWVRDGKVKLLLQFGAERLQDLPDVPTAVEMASNEESRKMLAFIAAKFNLARPFTFPPEVPKDRVDAMRRAFDATMKDPEFLAQAKKSRLLIDPVGGEDMTRMIRDVQNTPQDLVDKLRALIAT